MCRRCGRGGIITHSFLRTMEKLASCATTTVGLCSRGLDRLLSSFAQRTGSSSFRAQRRQPLVGGVNALFFSCRRTGSGVEVGVAKAGKVGMNSSGTWWIGLYE